LRAKTDPTTPGGIDFGKAWVRENKDAAPSHPDAPKGIANLQSFLAEPYMVPIEQESQRLKKGHGTRHWYSLFGGPANLRKLAEQLERGGTLPPHLYPPGKECAMTRLRCCLIAALLCLCALVFAGPPKAAAQVQTNGTACKSTRIGLYLCVTCCTCEVAGGQVQCECSSDCAEQ
jgi:hypothetical protein